MTTPYSESGWCKVTSRTKMRSPVSIRLTRSKTTRGSPSTDMTAPAAPLSVSNRFDQLISTLPDSEPTECECPPIDASKTDSEPPSTSATTLDCPSSSLTLQPSVIPDADLPASEMEGEEGLFQVCRSRKRRRDRQNSDTCSSGSESSPEDPSATSERAPTGKVVLIVPKGGCVSVKSFNAVKLSKELDALCPGGVLKVRPNYRENLLAVDFKTSTSAASLLRISSLCGVPVETYEPRSPAMTVGVIYGVPDTVTDAELQAAVRSDAPLVRIRRPPGSNIVILTFESPSLPERVFVGHVECKVHVYVKRPTQCKTCGRFGHVSGACVSRDTCLRCGANHGGGACTAQKPCCINCGNEHVSTSKLCPMWRERFEVAKYRQTHNVDFKTARAAVLKSRVNDGKLPRQTSVPPSCKPHTWSVRAPASSYLHEPKHRLKEPDGMCSNVAAPPNDNMEIFRPLASLAAYQRRRPNSLNSQPVSEARTVPKTGGDDSHVTTNTWNRSRNSSTPSRAPATSWRSQPEVPAANSLWTDMIFSATKTLRALLAQSSLPMSQAICELLNTVEMALQKLSR